MSPGSAKYNSNGGYFYVEFYVDGVHNTYLDSNFNKITIDNRINNHYPNVFLDFNIDNQVFIELNLYPQSKITVNIYYSDENNQIFSQPLILNLVIMEMNVDLPQKYMFNIPEGTKKDLERRHCLMSCVPLPCHEIMNATVNKLWQEPISIKNAVLELIGGLELPSKIIDVRKMNGLVVEQLIIPPMSFKNALLYLDEKYGIYDGKLFFNVNYNGTFMMWELKRKFDDMKPGGIYTVHKMPEYSQCASTYHTPAHLARTTDNNYVTYDAMKTICMPNDPFVPDGGQQLHIFHPNYDISQLVVNDPTGQAASDGIHSQKIDLKQHTATLKKRIVAFTDRLGDENGAGYANTIKANYIHPAYRMNYLYFTLRRKIKPHIVMKIGQPMRLQTYADLEKYQNSDYEGSYMIVSSKLQFSRDQGVGQGNDTVFATCDVCAVRTSQSHI